MTTDLTVTCLNISLLFFLYHSSARQKLSEITELQNEHKRRSIWYKMEIIGINDIYFGVKFRLAIQGKFTTHMRESLRRTGASKPRGE